MKSNATDSGVFLLFWLAWLISFAVILEALLRIYKYAYLVVQAGIKIYFSHNQLIVAKIFQSQHNH